LKKAFKNLENGEYMAARAGFNEAKNNTGMKSAAYYGLAVLSAKDNLPGYDLFKAFEEIKIAQKAFPQMDAAVMKKIDDYFGKEKLDAAAKNIDDQLFEFLKSKKEESLVKRYLNECKASAHYAEVVEYLNMLAFKKAESFNTELAYREFIENYPDASQVPEARQRIFDLAWEKADKENNTESYSYFIEHYPESPMLDSARTRLIKLEYKKALRKGTDAAYLSFIHKYPDSPQAAELEKKREEIAYKKAKRFNTLNVYQKFIRDFPVSDYTPEIVLIRDSLAFLEARKINTDKAYLNFVNTYPNARQVPQAMELLGNMSFSYAELQRMRERNRIKELNIKSINAFRVSDIDSLIEISIEYDSSGNKLVEIHQPEKGFVSKSICTYDTSNNMLTKKVYINGKLQKESEFRYFREGLIKTEKVVCHFDCKQYPEQYISKYYYDDKRNLIRKVDSSLTDTVILAEHVYQYDKQGKPVLEDVTFADKSNTSCTYQYNAKGKLVQKSTANQDGQVLEVISFTYDNRGRKISKKKFTPAGTIEHQFTYQENGLVKEDLVDFNNEKIKLIFRYEFFNK
jgi:TolA-binding protein